MIAGRDCFAGLGVDGYRRRVSVAAYWLAWHRLSIQVSRRQLREARRVGLDRGYRAELLGYLREDQQRARESAARIIAAGC